MLTEGAGTRSRDCNRVAGCCAAARLVSWVDRRRATFHFQPALQAPGACSAELSEIKSKQKEEDGNERMETKKMTPLQVCANSLVGGKGSKWSSPPGRVSSSAQGRPDRCS